MAKFLVDEANELVQTLSAFNDHESYMRGREEWHSEREEQSVNQSINQSINQSTNRPTIKLDQPLDQSIKQSTMRVTCEVVRRGTNDTT